MSYKNRKMMYDQLVEEKAFERIPQVFKDEFEDPENTATDTNWSGMTKDQLKKEAEKQGLEFTSKSTKDDLVVLLENKSDEVMEPVEEKTEAEPEEPKEEVEE